MDRISTQVEWQQRAGAVLPAGGFRNFDAGMIVDRIVGSRIWPSPKPRLPKRQRRLPI
jgi:glutamate-1-semialdehyde 2,1-aminomutase